MEKENDVALDESKTIGGTPPYISPDFLEALSSHKSFENASSVPFRKLYWYPMPSDVWAAGLTFLSSLTGLSPPWTTASFQDPHYLKFVQSNGHFFDRLQEAGLLDYYELRMINRMLDLNPAQRITAEDILNDPWFKTLDTTCSAYVAGKILTSE